MHLGVTRIETVAGLNSDKYHPISYIQPIYLPIGHRVFVNNTSTVQQHQQLDGDTKGITAFVEVKTTCAGSGRLSCMRLADRSHARTTAGFQRIVHVLPFLGLIFIFAVSPDDLTALCPLRALRPRSPSVRVLNSRMQSTLGPYPR